MSYNFNYLTSPSSKTSIFYTSNFYIDETIALYYKHNMANNNYNYYDFK